MTVAFFTIGHSTSALADFIRQLRAAQVRRVVDVRHIPRSRANPQFNRETLAESLESAQIAYAHIPALGGLRGRSRSAQPSPNLYWGNQSFRNYADYALTSGFAAGLAELRVLGRERTAAIMCAETLWWRCHRRIIADYLLAHEERVFHIMRDRTVEATLTPGALRQADGTLIYPEPASSVASTLDPAHRSVRKRARAQRKSNGREAAPQRGRADTDTA
jgi:uncharacterized protein (DUF488 family)